MFILNPDQFLLPSIRISPFKTDFLGINSELLSSDFSDEYFNNKFEGKEWQYTYNGREAMRLAFESYGLSPNDLITILTTSQNFYVSSCVTSMIETFCRWNREIVDETKIIFVIHEFGYPYAKMEELVSTGLPIIEDCCTIFFSQDNKGEIGRYGDFTIYSFPKFFPIQIGGLVVSNKNVSLNSSVLDENQKDYIKKVLSYHLKDEHSIIAKRKENRQYTLSLYERLGFEELFQWDEKIVPSAIMLNNHHVVKDLNSLKNYLYDHGIQNSIFYGKDAFFIPCHQNMSKMDIDYIFECIHDFIKN
jgi:hypothetical protein